MHFISMLIFGRCISPLRTLKAVTCLFLAFMLLQFACAAESGSALKVAYVGSEAVVKVKVTDAGKAAELLSWAMAQYEKTKSVERPGSTAH